MREQFAQFWQSQTLRLTMFYLAVIMVMSLSFSGVIYFASVGQLERQLPGATLRDDRGEFEPAPRVQQYLAQRVSESKQELVLRLGILNILVLVFGLALSYMLARKTLEPIERNVELQTRFVSDVSHELRTPLTAMRLTNEVALRQPKLSAKEAREVLQGNLEDIDRLQRLTSMSLDLVSDTVSLSPATVSVCELTTMASEMIAPQATQRQITIKNEVDKTLAVYVDSDAIVQALVGILDNAVKYSHPSGVITITSQKPRWGMVRLSIQDQGVGIANQDQEKIFERFYRSDEARAYEAGGGYGLGLSIARKLVEAHGGTIELRSEPGKGSTFTLVLPESKPPKSRPPKASSSPRNN